MGAEAQKRGLPAELPVMASLVESGLKNLNYGDAAVQAFLLLAIVSIVVGLLWNKIQHVYEEEGLKG